MKRNRKGDFKALRVLKIQGHWQESRPVPEPNQDKKVRYNHRFCKLRYTRKPCSCLLCGNRRRYDGPTMQERKANEALRDELEEILGEVAK